MSERTAGGGGGREGGGGGGEADGVARAPGAGEWVELARVREPSRLGILRSVLEAAGVEHRLEGEQVQALFPVATPGFFGDRGLGVVIHVRPEDLDDARKLLEERVVEILPDDPDEPEDG